MPYRNKTFISGDWTGDQEAVKKLRKYNDSDHWGLSFRDVHNDFSSDGNAATIKKSISERLDNSKVMLAVVGDHTANLRSGSNSNVTGNSGKSFVQYEHDGAVKRDIPIIAVYNGKVDKSKCPDAIKDVAVAHVSVDDYQALNKVYQEHKNDALKKNR